MKHIPAEYIQYHKGSETPICPAEYTVPQGLWNTYLLSIQYHKGCETPTCWVYSTTRVVKHLPIFKKSIIVSVPKFIPVNFGFFHQTCLLGTNTLINFFYFFPPDMLIWVGMFIRHSRVREECNFKVKSLQMCFGFLKKKINPCCKKK